MDEYSYKYMQSMHAHASIDYSEQCFDISMTNTIFKPVICSWCKQK